MEDSESDIQRTPVREDTKEHGLPPFTFYLTVFVVLLADQISKLWVVQRMKFGEDIPVIGNAFTLTLAQNTGGAWGILPSGNQFFIGFAVIATSVIIYAYHRFAHKDWVVAWAFALALGGALGNLTDRVRLGYVVDFLHARIINWPVFNIADSAITIGIILLIWQYIVVVFLKKPEEQPTP